MQSARENGDLYTFRVSYGPIYCNPNAYKEIHDLKGGVLKDRSSIELPHSGSYPKSFYGDREGLVYLKWESDGTTCEILEGNRRMEIHEYHALKQRLLVNHRKNVRSLRMIIDVFESMEYPYCVKIEFELEPTVEWFERGLGVLEQTFGGSGNQASSPISVVGSDSDTEGEGLQETRGQTGSLQATLNWLRSWLDFTQ